MSAREELALLPLNERIAALIAKAGITQEGLAATIGVGRPKVNNWVHGRGGPGLENAEKLALYASEVYGEPLPAGLFTSVRQRPPEASGTLQAIQKTLADLVELLDEQRQLVRDMSQIASDLSRLATVLERREAANGDE